MIRRLVIVLLVASIPAWSAADGAETDALVFLQKLEKLRTGKHIPGLSVAIVRDGAVYLAAGLGYADIEAGTPATAETPFNIASVTKPISAVAALRLVEDGRLDLDRPIAEYSEWQDFCARFSEQPSIFARDLSCEPATHTLRHLFSHTATGEAGTYYSYNPVLFSWASRPIMAVTGTSFSSFVQAEVLDLAGMRHSARKYRDLPLPPDLAARQAPPYRIDDAGNAERAPLPPPQGDGAAGGVVSTVLDLARFDIALDQGELITAESRAAMMAPTPLASGETAPYGLGWFVKDYNGHTLVWHTGWWEDAYSALYLKVPELGLSFILLANSEGLWWGNPLDEATIERSVFAVAFLESFVDGGSNPAE